MDIVEDIKQKLLNIDDPVVKTLVGALIALIVFAVFIGLIKLAFMLIIVLLVYMLAKNFVDFLNELGE